METSPSASPSGASTSHGTGAAFRRSSTKSKRPMARRRIFRAYADSMTIAIEVATSKLIEAATS